MSINTLPPAANSPAALLDYDETQRYLGGLSRSTIKTLAGNGEIARVSIGSRTMFLRSSLDAYITRITAAE